MNRFYSIILLLLLPLFLKAQSIELLPLEYNYSLINNSVEKKALRSDNFIMRYEIDTISLPFIDDFSENFQLRYRTRPGDKFVTEEKFGRYRVNGEVVDSIAVMKTETYSYNFNTQNQSVDTFTNASIEISEYNAEDSTEFIVGSFWLNEEYYYTDGQLVDTVFLVPDTIFLDSLSFIYVVNDTTRHWIDNDVFINDVMGINPPTVGVATFDGVDSVGYPYDFGNESSYGVADKLTSYPLNLEGKSNVVLSFYYQYQGNGNAPDKRDTLVLEFFKDGFWTHIWSSPTDSVSNGGALDNELFSYVEIPITDSLYLINGFQFRFKNYATLSGNVDHWNIDYVFLDANRTLGNQIVTDFGYSKVAKTFLKNYFSVPYEHYSLNPQSYMVDDVEVELRNLASINLEARNNFLVFDAVNKLQLFNSEQINSISFPSMNTETFVHSVVAANNNFSFPIGTESKHNFKIKYASNSNTIQGADINHYNDTIIVEQVLDTYYAYDDGTPERAIALAGSGAKMAYQFTLANSDTITAILINVLNMFKDADNSYRMMVWQDASGLPGEAIYTGDYINVPGFINEEELRTFAGFSRYELDTALVLPSGLYHIGWQQSKVEKFYIGWDVNTSSESKLHYDIGAGWTNYDLEMKGSLLLRPDFGDATLKPIISVGLPEQHGVNEINVYPNPAKDFLLVELEDINASAELTLYSVTGQLMLRSSLDRRLSNIDVSSMSEGMYLLRVVDSNGVNFSKKVLIND